MNLTKNCEPCELLTVNLPFLSQGTVVLRVNIRLVILTRKGRGIESQSFYFFFVLNPIRRGGLVQEERKSMNVSRNEERRESGSGERKRKGRQAFQERVERNRATRPCGLVCKLGLVIGYWNDNTERRWFAPKAFEWLTPSKD